ncbi:HAUS augmin-like complex subunit 6 [Excalfactoria chinensis]|uniref:HAUS augmin-like complex subunit 6 n=1 Tax=Excalfactoria chinensis TaxID=46218 RepID=UPI003B3BC02B
MDKKFPDPVVAANWEKEHLWFYLLALGFDPEDAMNSCGAKLMLGPTAFDKPYYGAFQAIIKFLFFKLDQERAEDTFRMDGDAKHMYPELLKLCSSWLKELSNEKGSGIPQVGNLLLFPSGKKFVHLMYQFARHVLIKDLRRNSAGHNESSVENVCFRPEGTYQADERCKVEHNELLQILLRKNYIIRKYEKTSLRLIKEIEQMKSESAHLQQQLQKMEPKDQNKKDRAERIQKVRSMWTLVMKTFTSLKKEMEIVDSVLGGCVDQYVFDGSTIVVNVPHLLVDKVENEMQEVCIGNLYEDEKLNFLTVIQLLNEALRILRDERYRFDLENYLQPFVDKIKLQYILLRLEAARVRIEKQYLILNESNSKAQKEWIMNWENSPGWLSLYRQNLGLDESKATLVAEENSEDDNLCLSPGSLSDIAECEINYENNAEALESKMVDSPLTTARRLSAQYSELSEGSEMEDLLTQKDLHIEPYSGKEKPVPPEISEDGKDELALSENSEGHGTPTDAPVKKEDILEKAREELAEEIARMVTSESPQCGEGRGKALDDLISSLDFNPLLTRKQIPRTPENLLTEIRNTWRKAIQSEDLADAELVSTEEIKDAPVGASPTIQDKTAISLNGAFFSSSSVPDFDYPLSEQNYQGSSAEFTAQKQMMISQISEHPLLEETFGTQEGESNKENKEKLEDAVFGESFIGKTEEPICVCVEKSLKTPCISTEDSSKMNILPSHHLLDLADKDLQWNVSPELSSDSCEVRDCGLLDETTPEEHNSRSPNKSVMSESDLGILDGVLMPDDTGNTDGKGNTQNLSSDLDLLLNRYKTLTGFSEKGQELHEIFIADESLSFFSDPGLTSEDEETDGLYFCLDEEFTKIHHYSPPDKTLTPLLAFSNDLEEMSSSIHAIPLDLINEWKDKEKLAEEQSTKD